MKNKSSNFFNTNLLIALDYIVISLLFFFFLKENYLKYHYIKISNLSIIELFKLHYKSYFLSVFFWILISNSFNLYKINYFNNYISIAKILLKQSIVFFIFIFTISEIKDLPLLYNKLIASYAICVLTYLLISRFLVKFYLKNYYKLDVLFIGNSDTILVTKENFVKNKNVHGVHYKDNVENVSSISELFSNQLDLLFIDYSSKAYNDFGKEILQICEQNQVKVFLIPSYLYNNHFKFTSSYINGLQYLKINRYPLDDSINQLIKLVFDKLMSVFVIIFLLSWLIPILGILIKIDSKGPIFFIQKRIGINGKSFSFIKFRTMRNDGTNSIIATEVNDRRITKIGSFLRKTSIDELPQFFNVLIGDMSIVGPRPHMIYEDDKFSKIINEYKFRNNVKPGITGLSQVMGSRGKMNTKQDIKIRTRLDSFYVRNWSFWFDIKIIYKTVELIFKGDDRAI